MHWITDLGNRAKEVTDVIKRLGHDGIVVGSEIVVFDPSQVKSVDNVGTFDASANIYKAFDPTQPRDEKGRWIDDPRSYAWAKEHFGDDDAAYNFQKWFAGSKVARKDGSPIVVYHGTDKEFDSFDPSKSGSKSNTGTPQGSFYFTDKPDVANSYTVKYQGEWITEHFEGANVKPVFLSIKNPLKVSAKGESWRFIEYKGEVYDINELAEHAQRKKYDGLIVTRVADRGRGDVTSKSATTYIAFSPTQIKSAIGNEGTFDPANPDITKSFDPSQPRGDDGRWIDDYRIVDASLDQEKADELRAIITDPIQRAKFEAKLLELYAKLPPYRRWEATLSSEQKQLLHEWGAFGGHIRASQKGEGNVSPERLQRWKELLDSAQKYEGTVYRGLSRISDKTLAKWEEAGAITLVNDQSASVSEQTSEKFTGNVLLKVNQKSGAWLGDVTSVFYGDDAQLGGVDEQEVVLRMGTTYKIDSMQFINEKGVAVDANETAEMDHRLDISAKEDQVSLLRESVESAKRNGVLPKILEDREERLRKVEAELESMKAATEFKKVPAHKYERGKYVIELTEVQSDKWDKRLGALNERRNPHSFVPSEYEIESAGLDPQLTKEYREWEHPRGEDGRWIDKVEINAAVASGDLREVAKLYARIGEDDQKNQVRLTAAFLRAGIKGDQLALARALSGQYRGLIEDSAGLSPEEDWQANGTKAASFKQWFGDWENDPNSASKVLNESGEPSEEYPIAVYHGTAFGGFKEFDTSKDSGRNIYGKGFYFTEDKEIANEYTKKDSDLEDKRVPQLDSMK